MPNIWSKKAYVQGFYCGYISFFKAVNIFERMDIAESIYEVLLEPSYKHLPGHTPTMLVTSGKCSRIRLITYSLSDE